MSILQHIKRAEKIVTDNSPLILTVVGVAGVVSTAVLAAKASFKASVEIEEVFETRGPAPYNASFKQKAKLVWPLYIPTVVSGTATVAAIITLNHIGTRRAAALAAAYVVSDKAFTEYKEKVREIVGEKKELKVRDDLAQDRVDARPVSGETVIMTGKQALCFESYTGRYWMCDPDTLQKAEIAVNKQIINDSYASLSEFYDEVGLPRTSTSDDIGWNTDKLMELSIHGTVAEDGQPCLAVEYTVAPIKAYHRFH